MKDYLDVQNAEGMPNLADSTVALEFLLSAKTGVRNYAIAITETQNPAARKILKNQMEDAINMHGAITELMIEKGWLHPYDISEQLNLDMKSSMTAVQIANLELFPGDTSRLGTFATPKY